MLISGRFALVYEGLEVFEVEFMRFIKLIKVKVLRGIAQIIQYCDCKLCCKVQKLRDKNVFSRAKKIT